MKKTIFVIISAWVFLSAALFTIIEYGWPCILNELKWWLISIAAILSPLSVMPIGKYVKSIIEDMTEEIKRIDHSAVIEGEYKEYIRFLKLKSKKDDITNISKFLLKKLSKEFKQYRNDDGLYIRMNQPISKIKYSSLLEFTNTAVKSDAGVRRVREGLKNNDEFNAGEFFYILETGEDFDGKKYYKK